MKLLVDMNVSPRVLPLGYEIVNDTWAVRLLRKLMEPRLKFYGWGYENTGLDEAERDHLFRFVAEKLGVEPRASAPPPQAPTSRSARPASPRPPPSPAS